MRRLFGIVAVAALALALALPASAADGPPSLYYHSTTRTVVIDHWKFTPKLFSVPAGTTIVWDNLAHGSHTSISDDGLWNSGAIAPGGTFSVTLDVPGVYPYHCRFGHGIHGTITVEAAGP
jgi:plastocyanin